MMELGIQRPRWKQTEKMCVILIVQATEGRSHGIKANEEFGEGNCFQDAEYKFGSALHPKFAGACQSGSTPASSYFSGILSHSFQPGGVKYKFILDLFTSKSFFKKIILGAQCVFGVQNPPLLRIRARFQPQNSCDQKYKKWIYEGKFCSEENSQGVSWAPEPVTTNAFHCSDVAAHKGVSENHMLVRIFLDVIV